MFRFVSMWGVWAIIAPHMQQARCKVIGLGIYREYPHQKHGVGSNSSHNGTDAGLDQAVSVSFDLNSHFIKRDEMSTLLTSLIPPAKDAQPTSGGGNQDTLTSIQSIYYVGPVVIGGETFQVIYDTGSNLLWVPGSACQSTCSTKSKYTGPNQSSNSPFTLTYGSGSVTGDLVSSSVTFADGVLSSFKLGLADSVGFPGYSTGAYDGLLGLAWPALSQDESVESIVPALYKAGQVDANLFAIYLAADGSSGELSVGEIDSSRYMGSITWMPLVLKQWWTLYYVGYSVNNGTDITSSETRAIIDSGTSLIVGPSGIINSLINSISEAIPNVNLYYDTTNQIYAVKCSDVNALPVVGIRLMGGDRMVYQFSLPGKSYVVPALSSDPSMCPLAFQPDDTTSMMILGDPFLRAFYTIYDYDNARVGLATSDPPAGVVMPFGKGSLNVLNLHLFVRCVFWIMLAWHSRYFVDIFV